jgi:hypothetical protein
LSKALVQNGCVINEMIFYGNKFGSLFFEFL